MQNLFLAATALWMVQSVRLSVCLSVISFSLCSHHRTIMNFLGVITNDKRDVHANGQGQMSKVKVTEVKTQLSRFLTVTPVLIHKWQCNGTQKLMWHRRGVLLFFKVIRQISRSHGTKNLRFWHEFNVSGLQLQFELTDGYEMMHKAWSSIENVSYYFSRSYIKFQGHTGQKIVNFVRTWIERFWISTPVWNHW